MLSAWMDSPVGWLKITEENGCITEIAFQDGPGEESAQSPVLQKAQEQLREYFSGKRKTFDLPVDLSGTSFQKRIWSGIQKIPYGETRNYGELAKQAGSEKAVRACGGACHMNPVVIVIPCHRVIGKNGKLTGFGGGLWRKEILLELEKCAKD